MELKIVFIPIIKHEINNLLNWIYYCPDPGDISANLVISIDTEWSEKDKNIIRNLFVYSLLYKRRWKLIFIDCKMKPDESFYIKDPTHKLDCFDYPYGHKSGPNLQFFRTCRAVKNLFSDKRYAGLLMEVDAFPVKKNWFVLLASKVKDKKELLILGGHYQGYSQLPEQIKFHYNGNSIYNFSHIDFDEFLTAWDELLVKSIKIANHMAYDVVINWYQHFHKINPHVKSIDVKGLEIIKKIKNDKIHLNDVLINWGGEFENEKHFKYDEDTFVQKYPNAIIVHGKCFLNTITSLRSVYEARVNSVCSQVNHSINLIREKRFEDALLTGRLNKNIVLHLTRNMKYIPEHKILFFKNSIVVL